MNTTSTCSMSLSTWPVLLRSEAILSVRDITRKGAFSAKETLNLNSKLVKRHAQDQTPPFTNRMLRLRLNPESTHPNSSQSPPTPKSTTTATRSDSNSPSSSSKASPTVRTNRHRVRIESNRIESPSKASTADANTRLGSRNSKE